MVGYKAALRFQIVLKKIKYKIEVDSVIEITHTCILSFYSAQAENLWV